MFSCLEIFFFFSSRRRHTRCSRDWSSDVCSSDLATMATDPTGSTCADSVGNAEPCSTPGAVHVAGIPGPGCKDANGNPGPGCTLVDRSEERRVGKECRSRWAEGEEKQRDGENWRA